MKKILTIAALVIATSTTAQTKRDTIITWYSVPNYDSVGNMTTYRKIFNYTPTKQDTIEFGGKRAIRVSKMELKKKQNKWDKISLGLFIVATAVMFSF
jgi:hypothetical protein